MVPKNTHGKLPCYLSVMLPLGTKGNINVYQHIRSAYVDVRQVKGVKQRQEVQASER